MGCDIHPYVEFRDKDGKWQPADWWTQDGGRAWRVRGNGGIDRRRHYNWFSFLAGVRNGTWGETIPVISEPKGLPDDCCALVAEASAGWDGHSHSWLTHGELQEAWKKLIEGTSIIFHGAVDPRTPSPELAKWLRKEPMKRGSPPGGFCASGGSSDYSYPRMTWVEPLSELIGESYRRWLDYLWSAGFEFRVKSNENDVRVVFWFDN